MFEKLLFVVVCNLWIVNWIAAMPRESSETSASFEGRFKYSVEEPQIPRNPTCRKADSCRIQVYEDVNMKFCDCPHHLRCGASKPVHVSGTDYYLCGPHKTPICKKGQTAMIVEGFQSTVLCSCRRRLLRGLQQDEYSEFTCGHTRQKLWIKKIQNSATQDQTERYVLD
ncbi:hypothetical protein M3Y98_00410000 [Aphelenchoides besseyi]|nr:hypothetical protein M3Y98_00410000 [Aphelenchoides besseyi]KAI6202031.1 hypothetical protein M3Y96_00905100 [Aphelenchoides besseyi]